MSRKRQISILILVLIAVGIICAVIYGVYKYRAPSLQTNDSEVLLLKPEVTNLTEEQYKEKAIAAAEESYAITMSANCAVDPLVIKVKTGAVLRLTNNDSVEHVMAFEDENFFAVSPGQTREIDTTTLQKNEGVYRYRCGEQTEGKNVGVLYISP